MTGPPSRCTVAPRNGRPNSAWQTSGYPWPIPRRRLALWLCSMRPALPTPYRAPT